MAIDDQLIRAYSMQNAIAFVDSMYHDVPDADTHIQRIALAAAAMIQHIETGAFFGIIFGPLAGTSISDMPPIDQSSTPKSTVDPSQIIATSSG